MPISGYSPIRDNNAAIAPGNIRTDDPQQQQIVNSVRQIMADLADFQVNGSFTNLTATNATITNLTVGTSLILPGAAAPTPTVEGDTRWDTDDDWLIIGDGAGQKIFKPSVWETINPHTVFSAQTALTFTNLSAYSQLWLRIWGTTNTDNNNVGITTSTNNGVSYDNGASTYNYQYLRGNAAAVATALGTTFSFFLMNVATLGNAANEQFQYDIYFTQFNKTNTGWIKANGLYNDTTGAFNLIDIRGQRIDTTARNAFQIAPSSGNISGSYSLMGIKG